MEFVSHSVTIAVCRVRTITVDLSRGGDYALADYWRQTDRFPLLLRLVREAKERVAHDLITKMWATAEEE